MNQKRWIELSRKMTWLFLEISARLLNGFTTEKGTIFIPLEGTAALLLSFEEEYLVIRNIQGQELRRSKLPQETGSTKNVRYGTIRKFVPSALEGLIPTYDLKDVTRICGAFRPSPFYVVQLGSDFLQNASTLEFSKGKTKALRIPFEERHTITQMLVEAKVDMKSVSFVGVKTSPKKNTFGS